MKRIGILTFWGVPNYGAFAQAYALNRIVTRMCTEEDVKHIAYLHPMHVSLYFKKKRPRIEPWWRIFTPSFYIELSKYMTNPNIEYPQFQKDWDSISNTLVNNEKELEETHWDMIITGSDAIWEYSVSEFGDDIHLIGNRLNCTKLISYAASFGDMNPEDTFKPFVKEGLMNYNDISVRDTTSAQIVQNITGITKVPVVLDPTLLHDFKNDMNIPIPDYEDYILVYGNDFEDSLIKEVREYAEANKLKVIGAGIAPVWCDIRLVDISPKEWIGMFKNAKFTVTCTFHGLMFSINYEKKVIFNQVTYVKNRSTYLLERLGLYELFRDDVSVKKVLNYEWDYNLINRCLDDMRRDSMEFLVKGLQDA